MSESNADVFVLETRIGHPIRSGVEVRVSLTGESTPRVQMGIRPFVDSVGMVPREARELAAQLLRFADQVER